MSRENVKDFYLLAEKDEQLKSEFKKINNKYQASDITQSSLPGLIEKEILPLAKKRGFNFSVGELMEYLEERKDNLSDEDLLNVSGGFSPKALALGLSGVLFLSLGAAGITQVAGDQNPQPAESQSISATIGNEQKDEQKDEDTKVSDESFAQKEESKAGENESVKAASPSEKVNTSSSSVKATEKKSAKAAVASRTVQSPAGRVASAAPVSSQSAPQEKAKSQAAPKVSAPTEHREYDTDHSESPESARPMEGVEPIAPPVLPADWEYAEPPA